MDDPIGSARPVPLADVRDCLEAHTASGDNEALDEAFALHPRRLAIDLASCDINDASGILPLRDAHRRPIRDACAVALRSLSARAQRNPNLARVDQVLQDLPPDGDLILREAPRHRVVS